MKGQWGLIFAFFFVFIVAIFAVINVNSVTVDYLFGTAQWPLVLVILASALFGALIVGTFGIFRLFRLKRENRRISSENERLAMELNNLSKSIQSDSEEVFPEELQKAQEMAEKALHPEHPETEENQSPKSV